MWKNKLFVKDSVRAIMHIPLNMGSVMKRMSQGLWQKLCGGFGKGEIRLGGLDDRESEV